MGPGGTQLVEGCGLGRELELGLQAFENEQVWGFKPTLLSKLTVLERDLLHFEIGDLEMQTAGEGQRAVVGDARGEARNNGGRREKSGGCGGGSQGVATSLRQ